MGACQWQQPDREPILTNHSGTLYTGVTNDLFRRLWQHRSGEGSGFTSKYKTGQLVWFEETDDVSAALSREKQFKNWRRQWKVDLLEARNPYWNDLAAGWFEGSTGPGSSPG